MGVGKRQMENKMRRGVYSPQIALERARSIVEWWDRCNRH
jgi:hypothetical protein